MGSGDYRYYLAERLKIQYRIKISVTVLISTVIFTMDINVSLENLLRR